MEFRDFKFWQFVNSQIQNLNDNEKEFIRLELEFPYTNLFRIEQLIIFLNRCRTQNKAFEPSLLFIRYLYEDLDDIYENSKELVKLNFHKISPEKYWDILSKYGI